MINRVLRHWSSLLVWDRRDRLLGLLAVFVASTCAVGVAACGRSANSMSRPDGGGFDGSLFQLDAANLQDGAVSGALDGPPGAPHICRISATWPDPDAQGVVSADMAVQRVGTAFYRVDTPAGPPSAPLWGKVSGGGARPDAFSAIPLGATPGRFLKSTVMRFDGSPDRLVTAWVGPPASASAGLNSMVATILEAGASAYPPAIPLLDAYWRGTIQVDFRSSFDGHRALFATGHVAVEDPVAAMIGPEGEHIGQPISVVLSPGGVLRSTAVIPTAHGAALSVVESDTASAAIWHIVELDDNGSTVLKADVSPPVPNTSSLHVAEIPTGFVALWADDANVIQRASVNRQTADLEPPRPLFASPVDPLLAGASLQGVSPMETGIAVLVSFSVTASSGVALVDETGRVLDFLPLAGTSSWIPSEAGVLALVHAADPTSPLEIVEVVCPRP